MPAAEGLVRTVRPFVTIVSRGDACDVMTLFPVVFDALNLMCHMELWL